MQKKYNRLKKLTIKIIRQRKEKKKKKQKEKEKRKTSQNCKSPRQSQRFITTIKYVTEKTTTTTKPQKLNWIS